MHLPRLSPLAFALGMLLVAVPAAGIAKAPLRTAYVARLHALNTGSTGTPTTGEAHFLVAGDRLTIDIRVHGAPPGIVHWQHLHGFKDGSPASCPEPAADTNHDGVIDLVETGKPSGTTMVPFTTRPAAMDVAHGTYPRADAEGNYHYHVVVSLKALAAAFAKAFPGQKLELDRRVVYVHGVRADTHLPATAASLGKIPASTTLPIACGQIEHADSARGD